MAGLPLTAFHSVWEVGDGGDEGSGPGCRQDRGNGTCMDPIFLKHRSFQAQHASSLSLLAVDVLSPHQAKKTLGPEPHFAQKTSYLKRHALC